MKSEDDIDPNTNIVYEPTARQALFHASSDDYLIAGGSRGSGVLPPLD